MKRIIFYLIGISLIALGSASIVTSQKGAAAWDALVVGLSNTFGLTPGNWIMVIGLILMLINAYLTKEKIDFYAFITTFTIGIVIDIWLFVVFAHVTPVNIRTQWLLFIFGFFTTILGAGIYLQSNFAPSPVDNLMLSVHKRFNLSISRARLICEGIALTLSLLVSGPISIGTFVIALAIGPCIQVSFKKMNTIYEKLG